MYTKIMAKRLESDSIKVLPLVPGWIQKDMGVKIASPLAKDIVADILNLLRNEVETGKLWHQGKVRKWWIKQAIHLN